MLLLFFNSIFTLIAIHEDPIDQDIQSIHAAWKFQSVMPSNYKITLTKYHLFLKDNAREQFQNVVVSVNKNPDINLDIISNILKSSGIIAASDPKFSIPTKITIFSKGSSLANIDYKSSVSADINSIQSSHNSTLVYQNNYNKAYQIMSSNAIRLIDISAFFFVPIRQIRILHLNKKKSNSEFYYFDVDESAGKGYCITNKLTNIVTYYESHDPKFKADRIILQKGVISSGSFSIPKCMIDYRYRSDGKMTIEVFLIESFVVDTVTESDFIIPYNASWTIKDLRKNPKSTDIIKYTFPITDITDHFIAEAPIQTSETKKYVIIILISVISLLLLAVAVRIGSSRSSRSKPTDSDIHA